MDIDFNKYTISFNEDVKGWTQFWRFTPDWMIGMNNEFYTFHNGNLYRHYEPTAPRNTFYGVTYPSKIVIMVNANPSVIKELQAVSIEGNLPWNMKVTAFKSDSEDFTESSIAFEEFINKEGFWYGHARRDEDQDQTDSKAVYGIGSVETIVNSTTLVINGFSDVMTIGDTLYDVNMNVIGTITNINRSQNKTTIVLNSINPVAIGDYVLGGKNPRIEGGNLRGYVIRFELELNTASRVELFALNAEVIKSFP